MVDIHHASARRGRAHITATVVVAFIAGTAGMVASRPSNRAAVVARAVGMTRAEPIAAVDRFTGSTIPASVDFGLHLIGELNCVGCHAADESLLDHLVVKTPPVLGDVGARINPDYLRAFILDPHGVKPGTTMPQLFRAAGERMVDPIVHYLVSISNQPFAWETTEFNEVDVEVGRTLYHRAGCVACHDAFEPPSILMPQMMRAAKDAYDDYGGAEPLAEEPGIAEFDRPSAPLGDLAAKTNVAQLTRFLLDPIATRPSGHMPAMKLTEDEARAISAYLLRDREPRPADWKPFEIDPQMAAQGRQFFQFVGCASCHQVDPDRPAPAHPAATPLRELDPEAQDGCLADATALGAARYELNDDERQAMKQTLSSLPAPGSSPSAEAVIDHTMAALNCFACHERDGVGGPDSGRREYFVALEEVDLGDEGRIPPMLTNVGWKAPTGWMSAVLTQGAAARPYMGTRMPQFGERNVGHLPSQFARVDMRDRPLEPEPEFSQATAEVGRMLVGADGFKCVDCHVFAGHEALATPGPDLATAHERIQYGYFKRWIANPSEMHPGTRMPTFWPGGVSPFPEALDGEMESQVDAIWSYLSLGEFAPLPQGLEQDATYELVVQDEPLIFRTFIDGAGARAIAVGFPEQVHCAFDAEAVRLALAWRGRFLSAAGAWAGRGGTFVEPLGVSLGAIPWGAPFAAFDSDEAPWPEQTGAAAGYEMKGYRLDDRGRPIFRYTVNGALIEEQPIPALRSEGASLVRRFSLNPEEFDQPIWMRVAIGGEITQGVGGEYRIDDLARVRITGDGDQWRRLIRRSGDEMELLLALPSGGDGTGERTTFDVEMIW